MKRAERQPWLDISGYTLCRWCRHARHARWSDGRWTGQADVDCEHPLGVVVERFYANGLVDGQDCWAFRPERGDTAGLARGGRKKG